MIKITAQEPGFSFIPWLPDPTTIWVRHSLIGCHGFYLSGTLAVWLQHLYEKQQRNYSSQLKLPLR